VLPHMRGVVRSISPLLFFVILSLVALGVIIHATYDYSAPAPAVATATASTTDTTAAAATAPATPAPSAPAPGFIFEQTGEAAAIGGGANLAGPLAVAGLLLLSVLIILRTMVAQAKTARSLSPLVYVVVAAFILLGVYVVANPETVSGLGISTTQSAP
jgi:ribose transport system permease protein